MVTRLSTAPDLDPAWDLRAAPPRGMVRPSSSSSTLPRPPSTLT